MNASGFTLVELLVVLLVLAVASSAVGVAIAGDEPGSTIPREIAAARERAVTTGMPVTVLLGDSSSVTLFPDGSSDPSHISDATGSYVVDVWTADVRHVDR